MQFPPQFSQEAQQALVQPYVRLAQDNMQLLTRFSASPEIVSLWMANAQKFFEQASRNAVSGRAEVDSRQLASQVQDNLAKVAQSDAFAELVRGLMVNYNRFLFELVQAGMNAFGQEQAHWMRQAQDAASAAVVPMPEARARRG